ncbi:MAG: hypothetical protein COZ75_00440 [Flavobacteriaceae bacterium CG_4_8_14_3_um_filter_34_10]|nr:hypothetical protein [Flavobacteriia bacterium]OIP51100.1 MAG: hypothetical protein AUK33_05300 [Flavobacteriaceae bacterium CG2_30_34_30]PIQ16929.1 MAG: hypothetical protein COW66_13825 [Flavobacteriaceae bacterium CG18_big_fil_WC_8_21_14_2_50_34_36]PIV49261.1 MAG: hypothetical protein COS19_09580 [Flavobacteriaceae bacterium CG02_land_8_20_14_3_00_34_13]PIX10675.1 MAG: hypothetical protein COZ75_00440 [Flavobacteriaceae bacterium CG_4_8_14_3_um_filter_34_10]PIZ07459.1 MAG: hypothetical pr
MKKEILIGFLIGIAANFIGLYLYIFFFLEYDFETSIQFSRANDTIGNLIALGAILNLVAFFLLLKKGQLYRARGVVFATIVAAIIILISKF